MKKKQEKPGYKNINIIDCFMLKMQLHNTITRFNQVFITSLKNYSSLKFLSRHEKSKIIIEP